MYNIHVAHYGIHSTHQHSQTRNAHPFYLHCFGSKIKRMFVAAAACALFFLVCVHVSAHHFHPFYGFKINQKIRLELFCCVVFSTHYLFCCCYDVFLHNLQYLVPHLGCKPESERSTETKKMCIYYLHRNMCSVESKTGKIDTKHCSQIRSM